MTNPKDRRTGYIFDEIFLAHNNNYHPENSNRLKAILQELETQGLLKLLNKIPVRNAEIKELQLCHDLDYIQSIKEFSEKGGGNLDSDTYTTRESYEAASNAIGGLIELCNQIQESKIRNGFAFVRPPGHHALRSRSMGFCIFGNVAISAKQILTETKIKRVAIVDFDVHHGNGTQGLIGDDPNILFISSHQFPYYPGTGSIIDIGRGDAKGSVINIPLPEGTGDSGIFSIYEKVVLPALEKFSPQFILVSAGYDAHWMDPLAGLNLSCSAYAHLSQQLINFADKYCKGKIVFALEGGYNLDALSMSVTISVKALLGHEEFSDPFGKSDIPEPNIDAIISELTKIHNL